MLLRKMGTTRLWLEVTMAKMRLEVKVRLQAMVEMRVQARQLRMEVTLMKLAMLFLVEMTLARLWVEVVKTVEMSLTKLSWHCSSWGRETSMECTWTPTLTVANMEASHVQDCV